MFKLFAAGAAAITATAVLMVAPGAPAYAKSPSCAKAIAVVNAAVNMTGGNLDKATQDKVAQKLRTYAELTGGEEKAAILGYVKALTDDSVSSLDPATAELNRVCGG
ncbi:MAG: hypothetical protein HOQ24_14130 [Mycobacteriaceae bacterium]|nr:hypothetical protein [Mycobacteriaceae bacterium]